MGYSKENYEDVEPKAPGMYFLRDALGCEQLGLTVVEGDEEWSGMEHDHEDEEQEEVYLLLEGSGRITVDGEEVSLESGDVVRVPPSATREYEFDEASRMIIAGAP
ncbi:cupin domain-containing protein [Halorarum halophilum]|uniref:Cupin domain-containing protein n=1 Tax=Halorarum halophilum TaxID=2743090 RepID=A0A7D5GD37_9EURY|nr:cupin domain-containing protein [Halobaculum halophilum]QLG28692.1 cupin domain-containing protein [Halobaculum halophilum]